MPSKTRVRCRACGHVYLTSKEPQKARCRCGSYGAEEIDVETFKELKAIEQEIDAEDALDADLNGGVGDLSFEDFGQPAVAQSNPTGKEPLPAYPAPQPAVPDVQFPTDDPAIKGIFSLLQKMDKSMALTDRRLGILEKRVGSANNDAEPSEAPAGDMMSLDGLSTREAISQMMGVLLVRSLAQSLAPPQSAPQPTGDGGSRLDRIERALDKLEAKLGESKSIQPEVVLGLQQQTQALQDKRMEMGFEKMAESMRYLASRQGGPDPTEQLFRGIQLAQQLAAPGNEWGYRNKMLEVTKDGFLSIKDAVGDRIDTALELQAMKEGRNPPSTIMQKKAEREARLRKEHPEWYEDITPEQAAEMARQAGIPVDTEPVEVPQIQKPPMSPEEASFASMEDQLLGKKRKGEGTLITETDIEELIDGGG